MFTPPFWPRHVWLFPGHAITPRKFATPEGPTPISYPDIHNYPAYLRRSVPACSYMRPNILLHSTVLAVLCPYQIMISKLLLIWHLNGMFMLDCALLPGIQCVFYPSSALSRIYNYTHLVIAAPADVPTPTGRVLVTKFSYLFTKFLLLSRISNHLGL